MQGIPIRQRCELCCFITWSPIQFNKHLNTKKHFNRFINPSAFPRRNQSFFTNNIAEKLLNDPNHAEYDTTIQVYTAFCNRHSIHLESLLEFINFKQSEKLDKNKDYNQEKSNPVAQLYYRILMYYKSVKFLNRNASRKMSLNDHLTFIDVIDLSTDPIVTTPNYNYNDIPYIIL